LLDARRARQPGAAALVDVAAVAVDAARLPTPVKAPKKSSQ
jgi:hypothetical protein